MNAYTAGKRWKIEKRLRIMETGFRLFSERGIVQVTMPEVAEASGISRATLFRYFSSKLELVYSIAIWKWENYLAARGNLVNDAVLDKLTGAEYMKVYLDAFLDLYHNHTDILCFNYEFNSYLRNEQTEQGQGQAYTGMIEKLFESFHRLYEKGRRDGTLNTAIPEETMFSGSLHIMLAAATRYAVGLVYVSDRTAPEQELIMLENMLLREYTREA